MPIKKETGEKRQFSTGAQKQHAEGKGTPVLVPGDAILDIAKHFEEGAAIHGDRNWEKGIPLSELLNSAERHLQQEKMGLTDENHARAFAWNAIVYLATKLRITNGTLPIELADMPEYKDQRVFEIDLPIYHIKDFRIAKTENGWYICLKEKNSQYLRKDLQLHHGTGWGCGIDWKFGEAPGYYQTKKLAEKTLQAYLDKERG